MINLQTAIKTIEAQLREVIGERRAIIGISGGLDSAVVASLCANAVGKENVFGVLMPYRDQGIDHSRLLTYALDIEAKEVNISDIVDNFDFLELSKLSKGNVMARARMIVLYAFANQLNGLVIGTGNKSEMEVGYFTKYGDGGVDVEPLGDLYKTEVFEIAKLLRIPKEIIDKKPSAELWEGQTDEDELGMTYEDLDKILRGEKVDGPLYERVKELRRNTSHKRHMPSVIKVRD